ncbi:hypothetical protein EDB84DRAFT_579895 [Lactarius hengduanensis]|nr:hypothetical protein EDB84DRAFT_579895 [Lactarius hengduanensis]
MGSGHQIALIFCAVPSQTSPPTPADLFLSHVQRFDIIPQAKSHFPGILNQKGPYPHSSTEPFLTSHSGAEAAKRLTKKTALEMVRNSGISVPHILLKATSTQVTHDATVASLVTKTSPPLDDCKTLFCDRVSSRSLGDSILYSAPSVIFQIRNSSAQLWLCFKLCYY